MDKELIKWFTIVFLYGGGILIGRAVDGRNTKHLQYFVGAILFVGGIFFIDLLM